MAAEPQYYFGDTRVKSARVESAGSATPAKLGRIAQKIWREVRESGVDPEDDKANEKMYLDMRERYADFAKSFPVVLRWMVQAREYDEAAFQKFLGVFGARARDGKLQDRKEFLETQADYLVALYKRRNPKYDATRVRQYRTAVVGRLHEEDKEFQECNEKAKTEAAAIEARAAAERRQRLYEYCSALKRQAAQPE